MNPDPHSPHDIAQPGPVDPATGQPDRAAEVSALKAWLRDNSVSLVISAVVLALIFIYLDPIDTLKVVLGLGLVIFIHELGHFLAAKWCDVHVKTFSIGFGPAVPFCSYKWGETTYMVGIIPLGGYVSMIGEGETTEGDEEGEEDPRSFKKKSVGQRMLIISAGVIMNVILGMGCFVAAYLHGVQEKPATIGSIESGGAAWRSGMRTGDHITNIDGRDRPYFDDLRPIVMSSRKDELVPISWTRDGQTLSGTVSPIRDEGQRFPQMGIAPPFQLTLLSAAKRAVKPVVPGTPAAAADPRFEPGDQIVAMSADPNNPDAVTPVDSHAEYHKRLVLLKGKDVIFRVKRRDGGALVDIKVGPAYRYDLGMRMRTGEVMALRKGSSAEGKIVAHSEGSPPTRGDRIKAVLLPPNATGQREWYVAGPVDWTKDEFKVPGATAENVKQIPLDPLLLPTQLSDWMAANPGQRTVELVVLRHESHTDVAKRVTLEYDPSFRFDREIVSLPNSPVPISALGLAYWVEAVVDEVQPGSPAAAAGLQPNDIITAVRFKAEGPDGKLKEGDWNDELKIHQWAAVDAAFQYAPPAELDIKVKRGDQVVEFTLKGQPNRAHPIEERGLVFRAAVEVQQATDVMDAIRLGALRTVRFIKTVYMNLYAMIIGRVSAKTMSGPLTIATVSYRFAGEDFWQFLLFLGLISVNLAVVNFLPIPVLDGGHMVFLILEKILGRPVPERVFAFAMYGGLFLILSLMVFVLVLDVRRLFFGWF